MEAQPDVGNGEGSPRQSDQDRARPQPNGAHHERDIRPWFKRPNLAWILCMKALYSLAVTTVAGPRIEIYTELVCRGYYPDLARPPGMFTQPSGVTTAASMIVPTDGHPGVSPVEVYLPPDGPATLPIVHNPPLRKVSTHASKHSESCVGDPRIQAEVARLAAAITIIGGILSCLTAGWWGGFLDRYGRARTIGVIALGPLMNDLLTILVFHFSDKLPGAHWFLIISPVLEGIVGVPSSIMAAEAAYIRDVSEPQHFARNFSLLTGVFYVGGTIGPALGGFLNERTGNVVSALYAAVTLDLTYGITAWVALPESLTQDAMVHARRRYADELASAVDVDAGPFRRQVLVLCKSFWSSFPLNVLAPKPSPHAQHKKDWNLTRLAVSGGLICVVIGSTTSVYQYALYTFRWSSLDLGYFISASGLSTAVYLTVILPAILSAAKHALEARRHASFDLYLVRVSCLVFAAAYAFMGIAPTGVVFTLFSIMSTFGQGSFPAIQSVATVLYVGSSGENDTGRLFGALGAVGTLGARIVGPALYGAVYAAMVSVMPSAILWLAVGCSLTAFLVLAFVRVPDAKLDAQSPNAAHHRDPELEPLLEHA